MNTEIINKTNIPFIHQPFCEQEVVGLFCLIAKDLGFQIKILQTLFPDCTVIEIETGKELTIEFELRSENFIKHRHPTDGCDLIVCWENDAKFDPSKIVELKEFFPWLIENPLSKKSDINIHQFILSKSFNEGIPYNELEKIFQEFHETNKNEPIRVIARLFKWGCFPYSDNGVLRIRHNISRNEYRVQNDTMLMNMAQELLNLLQDQSK